MPVVGSFVRQSVGFGKITVFQDEKILFKLGVYLCTNLWVLWTLR